MYQVPDCRIMYKAYRYNGTWYLVPRYHYLSCTGTSGTPLVYIPWYHYHLILQY